MDFVIRIRGRKTDNNEIKVGHTGIMSDKNTLIKSNLFWDISTRNPVPSYDNTRRHIPEDLNVIYVGFQIPHCGKSSGI